MITAKEARKMVEEANNNELKKFKKRMFEEIERCARCEMHIAKIYFNMKDELQIERANKTKEELISNGFVAEVYKNQNAVYYNDSGILSAEW